VLLEKINVLELSSCSEKTKKTDDEKREDKKHRDKGKEQIEEKKDHAGVRKTGGYMK